MATTYTTTTGDKRIAEYWTPGSLMEATEEAVVTRNFSSLTGVPKIGKKVHIPKIKRIAAAGGGAYGTGLNYTANTEEEITVTPYQTYGAVEVQHAFYSRMTGDPVSPLRKMILAGLAEARDQYGAILATGLTANVKGSGLASIDKGLLLDAQMALAISAKNAFKIGETDWFIKLHPSQIKNCMSIFDFTADYVTGRNGQPLVSGWFSKVLGAVINESGNVYQSGGVTHNLAYLSDAFVIGHNEETTVLEPQPFELVVRIIGTEEFGMSEQFDEFAVDIQTAA
jgi:hypothetical protein